MSGLPGYDSWKTYDSAGERAGALHEHIAADPDLSSLQDRVERRAARVDALAMALRNEYACDSYADCDIRPTDASVAWVREQHPHDVLFYIG